MIDEIKKVLQSIGASKLNSSPEYIEFRRLEKRLKREEWSRMPLNEKQQFRERLLRTLKSYREKDGIEDFTYENAVVKFYSLAHTYISMTKNFLTDNLVLRRFCLQLELDLEEIDKSPTLSPNDIAPLEIYDMLHNQLNQNGLVSNDRNEIMNLIKLLNDNTPPK